MNRNYPEGLFLTWIDLISGRNGSFYPWQRGSDRSSRKDTIKWKIDVFLIVWPEFIGPKFQGAVLIGLSKKKKRYYFKADSRVPEGVLLSSISKEGASWKFPTPLRIEINMSKWKWNCLCNLVLLLCAISRERMTLSIETPLSALHEWKTLANWKFISIAFDWMQ